MLVAESRLLLERLEHDLIDAHVDLYLARGGNEAAQGQLAGQELVEDDAHGVDVSAMIDVEGTLDLLRRHVGGGSHHRARDGE